MTAPIVVITDDEDNTTDVIEVMGPAMVSFHMTATTLGGGRFTECKPDWMFGDPSGRYNELRGFSAAHLWDIEPDENTDVTVRCTVTNVNGETAYAERTVRIAPNTRRIVYIDPDTGVASPADPTNPATPYNTISSAVTGESNGSNREYRFTEGKTHTWGTSVGGSGKSNIICRSTTKGVQFSVLMAAGGAMNHVDQGWLRDAHFVVSGRGAITRMFDPRSSGTSIRQGASNCTSEDPDVAVTVGSQWETGVSGSKSVLVIDTTVDEVHSGAFFAGPMMTFLGVSCNHSGGERPWRGGGDHILLYRCAGTISGAAVKNTLDRDAGQFFWCSESFFAVNTSTLAGGVTIGHSSVGFEPSPTHSVFERNISHGNALTAPFAIATRAQGVVDCVVRNNIFTGAGPAVLIRSETDDHHIEDVLFVHNTVVITAPTKIIIRDFYDTVVVQNNLFIGYPGGTPSEPECLNLQNTSISDPVVSDNVWPPAYLNRDVRVDGGTRIAWSAFNALGLGSGNLSKTVTVDGSYRPDVEDTDLLKSPIAAMAQFQEDYYGNPRNGATWVAGAVGVLPAVFVKRSFGVGLGIGV
jgi:hypothetical protein